MAARPSGSQSSGSQSSGSKWTPRETELLAATLELLRRHGYDRLTVEAVATHARASKATMYRRWPSKADLVLAAVTEGTRMSVLPPDTGSLRQDLLEFGCAVSRQCCEHADTMRAVLNEMSHDPALSAAMQGEFVHQRKQALEAVFAAAVERVRPKMMTVVAIMAGLLPIMWGTGTGSEVMSRIAAPMVGGMISSTVLTLAVIPAIYALVKQWRLNRGIEQ